MDRRAGAPLLKTEEAWLPSPAGEVVAAQRGVACTERCRKMGRRCEDVEMEFANTCEALQSVSLGCLPARLPPALLFSHKPPHLLLLSLFCAPQVFPCEGGCGHQVGDEIPAYVSDPSANTYRQCLTSEQKMPRCGASHRSTSRVCRCT